MSVCAARREALALIQLDPSFGAGGVVVEASDGQGASGVALALPGGSLLVARGASTAVPGFRNTLRRYSSAGVPDGSFGAGGVAILPFTYVNSSPVWVVLARQSDGKIIAAGRQNANDRFAVVRFDANGSPDPSFVAGGVAEMVFGGGLTAVPFGVGVTGGGDILVGGSASASTSFVAVAKITASGSPVSGFGANGTLLVPSFPGFRANAFFPFADGSFLVAGSAFGTGTVVYRFRADGTLDPAFASGGVLVDSRLTATATALDGSGRLIVVSSAAAARYGSDGSIDSTFGTGGLFSQSGQAFFSVSAVAVLSDDRVVWTGAGGSTGTELRVEGLTPAGAPDPAFGPGGVFSVSFVKHVRGNALTITPGGFLVSGEIETPVSDVVYIDSLLARFTDTANAGAPIPTTGSVGLFVLAMLLAAASVVVIRTSR
jgi:uncharacterized delta-60 repeat protein